jgi:hypothetical protein
MVSQQGERSGLPVWLKVVLVMLAIVIGLALIGVVAGVIIYKRYGQEWISNARTQAKEGSAFGATTDEQGCLERVLGDYRAAPGAGKSIGATLFLSSCLRSCSETPKFCSDVPPSTELTASVEWRMARCREAGLTDSYCPQLFSQVQSHCEAPGEGEAGEDDAGGSDAGDGSPP